MNDPSIKIINNFLIDNDIDDDDKLPIIQSIFPNKSELFNYYKCIYVNMNKCPRIYNNKIINKIELIYRNSNITIDCYSVNNDVYKCSLYSLMYKILKFNKLTIHSILDMMALKIELTNFKKSPGEY